MSKNTITLRGADRREMAKLSNSFVMELWGYCRQLERTCITITEGFEKDITLNAALIKLNKAFELSSDIGVIEKDANLKPSQKKKLNIFDIFFSNIKTAQEKTIRNIKNKLNDKALKLQLEYPEIETLYPDDIAVRKAKEKGADLNKALKDRLNEKLKDAVKAGSSQSSLMSAKIDTKIIKRFQTDITKTFEKYSKKDPKHGVPANIKSIAVTEVRGAINPLKYKFMQKVDELNKDIVVKKKWIHNRRLSKEYRPGHSEVSGKAIPLKDSFDINVYKKENGKWVKTGDVVKMLFPHDPSAPESETITCNCDIEIKVKKKLYKWKK